MNRNELDNLNISSQSVLLTPEQLKREKDIDNINAFIEVIDFFSISEHLSWGPKYIHFSILEHLEKMINIKQSPVFIVHDKDLLAAVNKLIDEWSALCSFVRQAPYNLNEPQNILIFHMPGDFCRNQAEHDLFEKIGKQIVNLGHSIHSFCQLINTSYLEINLELSSLKARSLYS